MNALHLKYCLLTLCIVAASFTSCRHQRKHFPETQAGWKKYSGNPVLGGKYGVIFDVYVLKDSDEYKMWCSWRAKKSIGYSVSKDGVHWSDPVVVLAPNPKSGWENDINRPSVIKKGNDYWLWYTGQFKDAQGTAHSWIGYATSNDGQHWNRVSDKPVMKPEQDWEKTSVMCPDVLWDDSLKKYKMWYSAGEDFEPDAIGYATSIDGLKWTKYGTAPIFRSDPYNEWEKAKVTACQVVKHNNEYLMFYIGFEDQHHAHIGIAKSKNGINHWVRYKKNPIISSGQGWDADAVYKPSVIFNDNEWLLWYNGRKEHIEQIGEAIHLNADLSF